VTNARDKLIVTIENADLNAMVTELAQENANLRLAQRALVRRLTEAEIKLATATKAEAVGKDGDGAAGSR
jgi:regulator of replication initiation timing